MRLEIESLDWLLADRPAAAAILRTLSLEQARLARRIDNLLSLARLEAGVARPHPEPVLPADLLRAARESLALILAERTIEVQIENRCPDLWVDPSLSLEVLVNLLENAARAAPVEAPIELAAGRDPQAPMVVRIEVRDRGSGLPPSVRRMLGLARELRPTAGSGDSASGGLGLQIARSLAEANGGSLTLLDRPGGGTIARLTLPAAVGMEEEDPCPA
jgi:two-component system sensor histidine kinase KdpD